MAFGIISIIHAVLAVFLIIELGLTAYAVSEKGAFWWWRHSPSSFNFMLFNSIWSILVLIYLALAPYSARLYKSVIALGLLVVTSIFWFSGSIAMAAYIGVPSCGSTYCSSAQAAVAFGFFIWAIFTGLTVMEGLAYMRSSGRGGARADGVKTSNV